jgi:MFS transporter, DHA2 family, methylenomycin A resistance protein
LGITSRIETTIAEVPMTAATTQRVPQRASFDSKSLVLFTTCLGVFIAQLDTSVVNLALKHVSSDLSSNVSQLQWIVDAYNLAFASFLLSGGILGDVVGRRRVFIIGNVLFALGSLACGFAPDNATLIAGRGLSGLGAALELPVSLAIVSQTFPDAAERARAIGIWASCNGIAWLVGPATGGLIVDYVGWRGIFLVTVPFGALACVLAWKTIAASRGSEQRSIDVPGQVLAVIALATFAFAFIEGSHRGWSTAPVVGSLIAAALAIVGFVVVEFKSKAPLLPVNLFRQSQFSTASLIAACMTFGMYATLFLMPLYLQVGRGASAFVAGLLMMPMPLAFVLIGQASGALAIRFGARLLMTVGMALMGAGQLLLAFITTDTSLIYVEAAFLTIGVGLGLNTGPVLTVAVSAAPSGQAGVASGIVNTARIVGATLGVAVLGALFASHAGQNPTTASAIVAGLWPPLIGGAIIEFAGALVAWLIIAPGVVATAPVSARPITSSSGSRTRRLP